MSKVVVSFLVVLTVIFAMVSCGGSPDACSHEWCQIASDDLLASPATCKSSAIYYSRCKLCGEKGYTYQHGEKGDHHYVENPTETLMLSPATCSAQAVFYTSCEYCNNKGTNTFSSGSYLAHNYVEAASAATLLNSATCTSPSEYYVSCSACNSIGSATFNLGSPLPHRDTEGDYMCDTCMKPLRVWDDIPVDTVTDIHHFGKSED
jgi:hypothetical protein